MIRKTMLTYLCKDVVDNIICDYLMPTEEDVKEKYKKVVSHYKVLFSDDTLFFEEIMGKYKHGSLSKFTRVGLLDTIMKNANNTLDEFDTEDEVDESDLDDEDIQCIQRVLNCSREIPELSDTSEEYDETGNGEIVINRLYS